MLRAVVSSAISNGRILLLVFFLFSSGESARLSESIFFRMNGVSIVFVGIPGEVMNDLKCVSFSNRTSGNWLRSSLSVEHLS